MYPQTIGGSSNENLTVRKINNGFEVQHFKEEKKISADGNNFLYDHTQETFAFDTAEEAVAKVGELLAEFK